MKLSKDSNKFFAYFDMIGARKKWEVRSCGQKGKKDIIANVLVIQRLEEQPNAICWGGF